MDIPPSCALYSLGCKVNAAEIESLGQALTDAGLQIVPWEEKADLYIINGCAVTAQAAAKTRQLARRIKREHPSSLLALVGCYSTAEPQEALACGADLVLNNLAKDDLVELLLHSGLIPRAPRDTEGECAEEVYPPVADKASQSARREISATHASVGLASETHTRALLKIQDGCNSRCSYCIIPTLRGRERSKPLSEIRSAVITLRDRGYQEIVLTGIHLSRWGHDFTPSLTLTDLLQTLLGIDHLPRIRLSSTELSDLDEGLIAVLASHAAAICPHLHIPLQSGCDETLRRMGRNYSLLEYRRGIARLRAAIPDVALTTDLIVGFPGETEEEFAASLQFCADIKFSRMHIFRFSSRKGTVAAGLPDKVRHTDMERRSKMMQEQSLRMAAEFAASFIGREVEVLLESKDVATRVAKGYSEHYLVCRTVYQEAIPRQGLLCRLRIQSSDNHGLEGEIVSP